MAASDILRYIDSIAREKEIDSERLLTGVEQAVVQAVAKKYGLDDLILTLDRQSGEWQCNYEIELEKEGRILAQAVKQAIIGQVREAERDVLYDEYEKKIGEIVNGVVQRFEGDTTIVNLGRNTEGIIPRAEKVRGEMYNIGDRIRAMVYEVKKVGSRVKVILTRAHRDLVRCLFELEVPEISDGIITIRRIEREPGYRTKLAVHSADPKVDCVGACVGVRGTRIKSIIDELNGERIDIIRWNEDPETLIVNALKPAEISHIELDDPGRKALVLVDEDQLSLAIGRKGQNVRLASKMTGWEIDIMTRSELEQSIADEEKAEKGEESAEGSEASEDSDSSATPQETTASTDGEDAAATEAPPAEPAQAEETAEPAQAEETAEATTETPQAEEAAEPTSVPEAAIAENPEGNSEPEAGKKED
ncbi:MAG: transcription termination factor NusA [Planctomycetota bacterium]|jgi:N utilization substance protein A